MYTQESAHNKRGAAFFIYVSPRERVTLGGTKEGGVLNVLPVDAAS